MICYKNGGADAVVVLHEIYGVNAFIQDVCRQYQGEGFDVYCPELLGAGNVFPYEREKGAYGFFMEHVGFGIYKEIKGLVSELKSKYRRVFIAGFSVGAALAWRCAQGEDTLAQRCEQGEDMLAAWRCAQHEEALARGSERSEESGPAEGGAAKTTAADGIICCYGSRIRDYLNTPPSCPALLLFAEHDSFDVNAVVSALKGLTAPFEMRIRVAPARHGFADRYSKNYSAEAERLYLEERKRFLNELGAPGR